MRSNRHDKSFIEAEAVDVTFAEDQASHDLDAWVRNRERWGIGDTNTNRLAGTCVRLPTRQEVNGAKIVSRPASSLDILRSWASKYGIAVGFTYR